MRSPKELMEDTSRPVPKPSCGTLKNTDSLATDTAEGFNILQDQHVTNLAGPAQAAPNIQQ